MKGRKHRAEEIVAMVREAESEIGRGTSPADMAKKFEVTEWTLNRWRHRGHVKFRGVTSPGTC